MQIDEYIASFPVDVHTLSRSEIYLPIKNHINTNIGDALNKEDLKNAIHGADAIIVTLGTLESYNSLREHEVFQN